MKAEDLKIGDKQFIFIDDKVYIREIKNIEHYIDYVHIEYNSILLENLPILEDFENEIDVSCLQESAILDGSFKFYSWTFNENLALKHLNQIINENI